MTPPLENKERRKKRDPEVLIWDRGVRVGHWLLVLAFATLYLEYRKFPLHAYAGYLVFAIVVLRVAKGFLSRGAARFSHFWYSPAATWRYFRQALRGQAGYHASHNPMGAAMVYALLVLLLATTVTGLLVYSAGQQLGPLGDRVPEGWEDTLILLHHRLGHLTAILVGCHLAGVVWAAWLHRENYVVGMLTGIRRLPRSLALPFPARTVAPGPENSQRRRWLGKLTYQYPVVGSLLLMAVIIGGVVWPVIRLLVSINKSLPSY